MTMDPMGEEHLAVTTIRNWVIWEIHTMSTGGLLLKGIKKEQCETLDSEDAYQLFQNDVYWWC